MMGDAWPYLTRGRKVLLILALIGLGYLLLQTRQSPTQISAWNANPFAIAPVKLANVQPPAIAVEAAPQTGRGQPIAGDDTPSGNPLGLPNTIITQGYGVGSHAPANIWGAVDLAIDGDGDGKADPQGTEGTPVYATQAGVVQLASNTYPAGNHIWVIGDHFKTGYSHLKGFAVQDGQAVKRGDLIGYVGSTGESSGPHLDYQVWKDGVNVNPLDYGALDQAR
ncbi:MAG TPA: M23 family metallopeptidase [Roseiflexaceae bacterium]|nr:M23 family metallopeptidase [Roseiflexaceae bacterium]